MLKIVLLLICLPRCIYPWRFSSTHTKIIPNLTSDVTLTCSYDGSDNAQNAVQTMSRIRILKMDGKKAWRTFAMQSISGDVTNPKSLAVSVSGHIGTAADSFLSVTWPVAVPETVGEYRCEVYGFDAEHNVVIVDDIFVKESATSVSVKDLLELFLKLNKDVEKEHELFERNDNAFIKNQNESKTHLENLKRTHDDDNLSLSREINSLTSFQEKLVIEMEKSYYEARNWPAGPYSLLMPESGCPEGLIDTWVESHFIFGPGYAPTLRASPPTHLKGNQHYFDPQGYLRFCQKKKPAHGISWPKGKYCIQSGTASCPPNMMTTDWTIKSRYVATGQIIIKAASGGGPFLAHPKRDEIVMKYCCRTDGDQHTPMLLPADRPFYLFRSGNACQQVRYMDVTSEWVELFPRMSTVLNASFSLKTVHPDIHGNRTAFELCYYTPL